MKSLNKEVFITRAKTAVVYAAVMLTALFWNEWSFLIIFSIIQFGAWYEFRKLVVQITNSALGKPVLLPLSLSFLGWGLLLAATAESIDVKGYHVSDFGWHLIRISFIPLIFEWYRLKNFTINSLKWSIYGLLYISLSLALLINLRSGWIWGHADDGSSLANALSSFSGHLIVLVLVITIWINDTMAYMVGSWFGKTPLSVWSPKKTWEGTVGGIVLSSGLIYLIGFLKWHASLELLGICILVATSGTFGDLIESKLKRMAGVKDSGSFLPGHGGFLDRFDSILFAAPVVWIFCYLFYR
jgi:phosphatidate cytidylyltransferase